MKQSIQVLFPRNLSVSPERESPLMTPWQKKPERRSMSSDGMSQKSSSQSSTDWGYTSYNNFTANNKTSYNNNNSIKKDC